MKKETRYQIDLQELAKLDKYYRYDSKMLINFPYKTVSVEVIEFNCFEIQKLNQAIQLFISNL